jgi:uncharacterized membrane protein YdjX (TVP38/TMEM64 family)
VRRIIGYLLAAAVMMFLLWSIWDREMISSWMVHARPLPFFLAMAILPAFGAPLTPFLLLAGATFGVTAGLIGSGVALLLNLTLCYWIARSSLRPWLESLLSRWSHELPNFAEKQRSDRVRFALMVRLAPGVPTFVKNYGLATAAVPFGLYLLISMLITGTYSSVLLLLGDSLLEHDVRSLLIVAGCAVVLAGALWWWRKRSRS